jgi:acylphosphatase
MDEISNSSQLRIFVHGRVQGVFFRDFVCINAQRLGLAGLVRNLPDGYTIEVIAQGPRAQLEKLLKILRQGPPEARVDKLDVEWGEHTERYGSFRVVG